MEDSRMNGTARMALVASLVAVAAASRAESVDYGTVTLIRDEGFNGSKVMDTLARGPRAGQAGEGQARVRGRPGEAQGQAGGHDRASVRRARAQGARYPS